jgi:tetratricopeptide (TPR) repeat protein
MNRSITWIALVFLVGSASGALESSLQSLREDYDQARSSRDKEAITRSAYRFARRLESDGNRQEALRILQENLDVSQRTPSGGVLITHLARMYYQGGNSSRALEILSQSVSRATGSALIPMAIELTIEKATVQFRAGDLAGARESFQDALTRAEMIRASMFAEDALHGLQYVSEQKGDTQEASEYCRKRFKVSADSESKFIADVANDCARLFEASGDSESAKAILEEARRVSAAINVPSSQ